MEDDMALHDPQLAAELWARLASEGKAPNELTFAAEALPAYSVAIDPWIDRLARTYLRGLSQRHTHSKVVIAPYGGGKTHFLMSLGSRALEEGFAVAYVACADGINFDNPLDVYRACMKSLQLPGEDRPGTGRFLRRVVRRKNKQITDAEVPDPEAAFEAWLRSVESEDYPELSFGRVLSEALRAQVDPTRALAGDAAVRWLRGEIDTLTKDELGLLKLRRVSARDQKELGRNLLLSIVRFAKEAGVLGTVLLFDEVETLFNARGKALQRLLSAMRIMLDLPAGIPGGVPMLGVYAAVPDILEQLGRYPALQQRLAVVGVPFEEGNDYAAQLHLDRVGTQKELLHAVGLKLLDLGRVASGRDFDDSLQDDNIKRLAHIASESNLEIDARRLFVKTCVNILQQQAHQGERRYPDDELLDRYRGFFESLRNKDQEESEP